MMTATYSPEDNKLRLYSAARLDAETYARVKEAGFKWAPAQSLFVAPCWTPDRAALLEELAGDIGDEDTSLSDRASERAERFEGYSEKRANEADRARAAVSAITANIPLGQPILIGHHSERHARKDAERIERGMQKAVNCWKTSRYWVGRAASAIAHAKYKELPGVRARRIKTIEADQRKAERAKAEAASELRLWETCADLIGARRICDSGRGCWLPVCKHPTLPQSLHPADVLPFENRSEYARENYPTMTLEQVKERARIVYVATIARCDLWLNHYANRIAYERAMLAETGGLASSRFDMKPGGQVLRRGSWYVIHKVNAGSVSVFGHFAPTITHDEIKDYRPPTEDAAAVVARVSKLAPLCNYPGEGFKHMTRAELDAEACRRWSDFPKVGRINPTEKYGAHRIQQTRGAKSFSVVGVFITDAKRKDPPAPNAVAVDLKPKRAEVAPRVQVNAEPSASAAKFEALADSLAAGVQVVSAPNLFPTPANVAERMVQYAGIEAGHNVLEPSAGTGAIIRALWDKGAAIHAVEINAELCRGLEAMKARREVMDYRCGDFLAMNGELGLFDRVVMNPPFENGIDIAHIRHALEHTKPGGRVVALCANGPRQQAAFKDSAEHWEDLPAGTFTGTNVRAAIVVLCK